MRGSVLALIAALSLTGCTKPSVWATEDAVREAVYRHSGPSEIALVTVINNRSGKGGHTALMVNGSQRLIYDPAGTFKHESIPERHDVLFGITPSVEKFYMGYHTRKSWHVKIQRIRVSRAQADRVLQLMQTQGTAPDGYCARSTSAILMAAYPGQFTQTFWPVRLSEQFERLPGVSEETLYEDDSDDNTDVLREWTPE